MSVNFANMLGCVDENGYLRVTNHVQGAVLTAPTSAFAGQLGVLEANSRLKVAVANSAPGGTGPRRPLLDTRLRCDENGALLCNRSGAGVTDGPLQGGGQIAVRVDDSGLLLVSQRTPGSLSSPATPLANLALRCDENGYLIVCY